MTFFKVTEYLKVTMGTQLCTYQWYVKQNVKKKMYCKHARQPAAGVCFLSETVYWSDVCILLLRISALQIWTLYTSILTDLKKKKVS